MKLVKVVLFVLIFISQLYAQNGAWYQMTNIPFTMKNGCCICWGEVDCYIPDDIGQIRHFLLYTL